VLRIPATAAAPRRSVIAVLTASVCHALSENRRLAAESGWHGTCFIFAMKMNADQRLLLGAIVATALMLCRPALAIVDATSLESIRHAAELVITSHAAPPGTQLHANAATLDPRLQLAPCAALPRGVLGGDGQLHDTVTVAVRCEAPVRWTVYVRVAVTAELPVLTARRLLPRGVALGADDFELRPRVVNGLGDRYPGNLQCTAPPATQCR
jgi:flagella basal body P-ring formation protein FlgA